MNVEGRCFNKNFRSSLSENLSENQLGNKMINLLLFIQDFFYICQLFDQRLRKILWNISKDISDCYQHKLKINPISIIEVPFKTFYAGELVKYLHNRFRGINELLCIELYIYNCKINTCQKSSS